jgi:hypothetical protein
MVEFYVVVGVGEGRAIQYLNEGSLDPLIILEDIAGKELAHLQKSIATEL